MAEDERQRVERAGGRARRARLTPAPGPDPTPEAPGPGAGEDGEERPVKRKPGGKDDPDDDRITRERPPHW